MANKLVAGIDNNDRRSSEWASVSVDPDVFRGGMRTLGAGVTVVTACHGREAWGLTATAVCSLSIVPPRLLACVNVSGETFRYIEKSRRMTVNVLSSEHESIARRFAKMTAVEHGDLFEPRHWHAEPAGAPCLTGALATFECAVNEMFIAYSHAILIGEVQAVRLGPSQSPLIYLDGRFASVSQADKPC
jgi:flavin reductase (DIM6/NTAB) family NADH-FMN oxidoreductase RutF